MWPLIFKLPRSSLFPRDSRFRSCLVPLLRSHHSFPIVSIFAPIDRHYRPVPIDHLSGCPFPMHMVPWRRNFYADRFSLYIFTLLLSLILLSLSAFCPWTALGLAANWLSEMRRDNLRKSMRGECAPSQQLPCIREYEPPLHGHN